MKSFDPPLVSKRLDDECVLPIGEFKNLPITFVFKNPENFEFDCFKSKELADLGTTHTTFPETNQFSPRDDHTSLKVLCDLEDMHSCSALLNVTDYMNQVLNQDHSKTDENQHFHNSCDETILNISNTIENAGYENDLKTTIEDNDNEFVSSQKSCSQESILISDEELDYSSLHSKNAKCNKYFYGLSEEESNENNAPLLDVDEVYNMHSVLKAKYGNKEITTPVHNRISELRSTNTLMKTSLKKEFFEDSFNEVLEDTKLLKELESNVCQALSNVPNNLHSLENANIGTPEKCPEVLIAPKACGDGTPENSLIIKTKDVTPLANYDEMDTPEIKKELQKFGLKPLKRQRGVKLLKYLYECTHPLVRGPGEAEEISSDEIDENRMVKKRKVLNESSKSKHVNLVTPNQDGIEIIGDSLLENEKLDDLIFERKHSVKLSTCHIPLQIVWHNFLSKNACVREHILLYEPLQLEVLHTLIKEQAGCKFHIEDLLTFFDRKCITIRTAQGSQRMKRKVV